MAYTRMEKGTTVMKSRIDEADVIATCECGGEIIAIEADDDGDWVANCTGCGETSCWIQNRGEILEYDYPEVLAEVIPINERRLACRQ